MNQQESASEVRLASPSSTRVDGANETIRAIVRAGHPYVGPEEIQFLAPHIKAVFATIPVDLGAQDAYQDKRTKLWVTTNRLHLRLLRAAGVDILSSSGPIETGDPDRIEYRMCARALWFDGRHKEWTTCYELNLQAWRQEFEANPSRDKDPALQLNELRKHGLSRAESGARGRLVQLLGLDRRGFTMETIKRGFKVASAVIDVGDDPTGRDMLLAASLGLTGSLYSAPAAPSARRSRPAPILDPSPGEPPRIEPRVDLATSMPAAPTTVNPSAPTMLPPPRRPRAPDSHPAPSTIPVRFETLSVEEQLAALEALAGRKRYSLDSLKTARGAAVTIANFTPGQRLKFYEHLSHLPDAR